ncbi:MAG: lytic transglycosylase domain-containing protein [Elusimicrobiota bacterium]|jgi:soluble lytic murein transglycosylase|nr:lytic transglycosylase domain-containing protein [Elusimicrobiota bacterium]
MSKKFWIPMIAIAGILGVFAYFFNTLIVFNGSQYEAIINKYGRQYEVDPLLIRALIKRESNVNPNAISNKGAMGLMQIMPKTGEEIAQQLNISDYNNDMLKNPEINIMFGAYYMRRLLRYYDNDIILALGAYNAGLSNIDIIVFINEREDIRIKDLPFDETSRHIRAVMLTYQFYKGEEKLGLIR